METMKASTSSTSYVRLDRMEEEETKLDHRKGVFPVLVGSEGTMEKFLLPMKLTRHPFIVQLLELSAKEYGFEQEGLLKIPYDASCFKKMLKLISKK
ncbi:SAUR-LIKE AUXIN-RESPONSIVE FAMILY PROTEIN [Salix viminalis]|uniref:SAUR-LIKE AUXIN-RESPONSIVE FAMILY PROTEIN n=1 Tax=Salix viminalis TaxID=40686 RepID=A0A6N2KNB9_SALVM|nr:SAUR-LIKE AUXIN-RESPONSIVE FAMILY PROTEIN [Salix viminalis]